MPFVNLDDGRLFYESCGAGKSAVLIHSAWASHEWWRWQIPELSKHYRVITMDVRGHGQSSPLAGPSSVPDLTKDLAIFLHAVSIDMPVLVGWSMGGILSMQYSIEHPQNVSALILIATSGHKIPRLKFKIYFNYIQALLGFFMEFAQPRKFDRAAREFPRQNAWLAHQVRSQLSASAPQEVVDWILSDIQDKPRENFFAVIKSLWDWEVGEKLQEIKVPTLIMAGEMDTLAPPEFSKRLHDAIPNSKLVIVANTSHYLVMEKPEVVNAEILSFLKSIGY